MPLISKTGVQGWPPVKGVLLGEGSRTIPVLWFKGCIGRAIGSITKYE